MEISFQDSPKFSPFSSQSGQGILEYILVLLVAIAVIMGGVYQLNDAFKTWANNYFGNYLACLLETGDLPSIGGTPGDSGVCNQLFEPFNLAKGRRLKPIGPTPGSGDGSGSGNSSQGSTDKNDGKNGRPNYQMAGGGRSRGSGWAGSGGRSQLVKFTPRSGSGKGEDANTGSTSVSSSGGSSVRSQQNFRESRRILLDNGSVAGNEKEERNQKRKSASTNPNSGMESRAKNRIPLRRDTLKKQALVDDEPLTFGNFIRILLIAAILIALIMVIGGQLLSMGKMEQ